MRYRSKFGSKIVRAAVRASIKFSDLARRTAPVLLLTGIMLAGGAVWLAMSTSAHVWVWKGWERMFGHPSLTNARPRVFAQVGGSAGYTITSIDESNAGTSAMEGTMITAVNASGAMTGAYSDQVGVTHGFVCAAGGTSCTSFDASGAGSTPQAGWFQGTIGLGIDTAGDIVGAYADSNSAYHGFFRKAGTGAITELNDPNELNPVTSRGTFPMAINDIGQVVGFYSTGSYDTLSLYHGFVYSVSAGTFTELDDPNAGTGTSTYEKEGTTPMAINASGVVTGYYTDSSANRQAFIATPPYSTSSPDDFTTITVTGATTNTGKGGGFSGPIPMSIDTAGDVVGTYTDSTGLRHGFIVPAGITTAAPFNAPGANTTSISGIYDGTFPSHIDPTGSYITGVYTDSTGLGHGFVYYLPLTGSGSFTSFTPPNTTTSASLPFGAAFSVNASGTVVGFYLDSSEVSHGFQYTSTATPTPTFSPAQGTYTSTQSVTISDTDSAATIYYTTDGSTPTLSSTKYTDAISVSSTETINAIALDSSSGGYIESAVASAVYTINTSPPPPAAVPTFVPPAGTYTSAQSVTISDATPGATIYYTTNGTTPTTGSTVFSSSSPIAVSSSETIEAIAAASGYSNSSVGSAAYTINIPVAATPTFSPAAGTYTSAQSVTISDATSGATIYYTTNGTTPTTGSTVFSSSSPIAVSSSETIEAIAAATGYSNSTVASAAYAINLPGFGAPGGSQPGSISIEPGASTGNTATISVVGTNGFSGTVNLTCAIAPVAANDVPTCSLSPSSVTLSGTTTQTSTLTVSTTAATGALVRPAWRPLGGTALAVILMLAVPRRRRGWLAMLVLLAIAVCGTFVGCGGKSGGGGGNSGTSAGTYTVTVTGTSGTTSAAITTVSLTVK